MFIVERQDKVKKYLIRSRTVDIVKVRPVEDVTSTCLAYKFILQVK